MSTCTAEFLRLSAGLGDLRCGGSPVITLRNPLSLQSWTMPVIELLMVVGAAVCLIHALRWRRNHGDSSNLLVWFSSIICLLLIEPIAYFPQSFGLQDTMGLTFVHNAFSVQFLYDRLPLYIVAMYPAFSYIAWILVQRTGIFTRFPAIVGATAVAFVFHCLYEVIDTVGVQFRWWVWNETLSTSTPSLGVVPYLNLQAFSIGIPFGLALITLLVGKRPDLSNRTLLLRIGVVSILVWPIQFLFSAPATLIDLAGASIQTGRFIGTWLMIVVAGIVTAVAFIAAYRQRRTDPVLVPGVERDYVALVSVVVYLVAALSFWIAAVPDYLQSSGNHTAGGVPVGSLPYAIITFVLSLVLTAGAYAGTRSRAGRTRVFVKYPRLQQV